MAAVAIAGIGMMMVCSSSLAAVMLMGGEEETPTTTTTTSAQSAAGPTGDEDDDTGDDDSGGGGGGGGGGDNSGATTPTPAPAVEYHWREKALKKISVGVPFKSIENKPLDACKQECENQEECSGFNRKRTGTKKCVFYSGDVSTSFDLTRNTYLLRRV